MSGGHSSSRSGPNMGPSQVLDTYNQGLPEALGTTFGQAPVAAQGLASAAAGANPIYTESGLQQLNQYLPGYVAAGGAAAAQQANNTANLIGGPGGQAAIGAENLNRIINPEFYNTRNTLANQTDRLFSSIGGPHLSPQEMAATERAVNQGNTASGNLGQFNAWNTVGNAMNFGQALRQKQSLIGNTIAQTTPLLSQLQNTNNTAGQFAVNAGNVGQNFGAGTFNPTQANPNLNAGTQFAGQVLGGAFGYGNSPVSRSSDGKGGVICSFVFTEAYYGNMPWFIRKHRDKYYNKFPDIAVGYKRMCSIVVPMMRRFSFFRKLVWRYMVFPLTQYGSFVIRQNLSGRNYKNYRKFWLTVWNFLGK